jgi:RNA polymerase sigma-70 factor, ECF subfamily
MRVESAEIVSRIWEESRTRLKGFIDKRISNEADAEDVLQNVFFKIHQGAAQLKDPEKLYPWVFQTTRNAIIDYYRERKITADSSGDMFGEIAVEPSESDVEEEVLQWLEPMVGELPEKYREALLLTDIQGLTQKELSEKLDLSLSGAKSRVQRARDQLKDILLECCHLEFNRAGKIVEYKPRKGDCGVCSH